MRVITSIEDASSMEGEENGLSNWEIIDQTLIDQFAEATADYQWIHVDTAPPFSEILSYLAEADLVQLSGLPANCS